MKQILELILAVYARLTLILHKPKIVGITGSVGKTSAKDAVALVLSQKFKVGASHGNFNSELGLPLSVLGIRKKGGNRKNLLNALKWFWILIEGFFRIFNPRYPEVLVLEMGSGKPGDIAYLLSIIKKLDVAVVTDIGVSHMEFFGNQLSLLEEKLSILKGLDEKGFAVLNADNDKVLEGKNRTTAKIITYGFAKEADIFAQNFHFPSGILGNPSKYAILAAVAVGRGMGMDKEVISGVLKNYQQPPGRLRLIQGKNNTKILDDTYNAAPASTIAAIDVLISLPGNRKIAAMGEMAELGEMSETGHREVAAKIFEAELDELVLVGDKTRLMKDELQSKGFQGKISWFARSDQAASFINERMAPGDNILVKGSQSARMEKIVKKIMAHPDQANQLLVRQGKEWL